MEGSRRSELEGKNWKSEMRRSAHLLPEKLVGVVVLWPPLMAESLVGRLGFGGGGKRDGVHIAMLRRLRASIEGKSEEWEEKREK